MRRVVPWSLLGMLAMATAFGIWLGLDQAPTVRLSAPVLPATSTPAASSPPRTSPGASLPSPTTTTTIAAQPCTAQSLQLTTSVVDSTTPTKRLEGALALTNQSSTACELSSSPVVEILGRTGALMATTASLQPAPVVDDVIKPGRAEGANLVWQNWCGPDLVPLTLTVVLANGGGVISGVYGDASTMLPACTNSSVATKFSAERGSGASLLFGH